MANPKKTPEEIRKERLTRKSHTNILCRTTKRIADYGNQAGLLVGFRPDVAFRLYDMNAVVYVDGLGPKARNLPRNRAPMAVDISVAGTVIGEPYAWEDGSRPPEPKSTAIEPEWARVPTEEEYNGDLAIEE